MTDAATPPVRRGRPGHDQAAVLRTAIDLFNRHGYNGTSIADIAAALGVTKSAIYHHVDSKEDLLAAALEEALAELTTAVEAAVDGPGTAHDRLRVAVHRSVEILIAHQPAVTLLLRVHGNSQIEQAALQRRRELDEKVADLVAAAIDEGALRSDIPPPVASRLLFGLVNSLVEWYRPDGPIDDSTLADDLVALAKLARDGVE
jgi:AcrR family transcriptional regulator